MKVLNAIGRFICGSVWIILFFWHPRVRKLIVDGFNEGRQKARHKRMLDYQHNGPKRTGWEPLTKALALTAVVLAIEVCLLGFAPHPKTTEAALSSEQESNAKEVCHNRGFAWAVKRTDDGFVSEVDCIFPVASTLGAKP